ncbi:MAG: hypothetical protein ACLTXI_01630 [Collinsella sp.]
MLVDGSGDHRQFRRWLDDIRRQSNFSCRHERQLRLDKQKYVDTLALKIDFNDLDMPTTVITYISERTKTSSREYRKAEGELMNAVGALEIILNQERATW